MLSELYEALKKLHKEGKYLSNYYNTWDLLNLNSNELLYAIKQREKEEEKKVKENDLFMYSEEDTEYKLAKDSHNRLFHHLDFYYEKNKEKGKKGDNDIKNSLKIADLQIMLECVNMNVGSILQIIINGPDKGKLKMGSTIKIYKIEDWYKTITKEIEKLIKQTSTDKHSPKNHLKF